MTYNKDYFGLDRTLSLILAVIPFTAWVLGILTRLKENKPFAAIIRVFGGLFIWLLDLIFMITDNRIVRILNF